MSANKPRIPAAVGVGKGQVNANAREIVNTGRAMLLRALEIFETKELISPAEHLSTHFKSNPLRFMEIYAKFMPRDVRVSKVKASADDYSTHELQELLRQHVAKQMDADKAEVKTIEHNPADTVPSLKVEKVVDEVVVEFDEPTGLDAVLLGK